MAKTKVVVLAASKGGVGKTTMTISLAVRAAENGERVAVLDQDLQKSLAAWHERRRGDEVVTLLEGDSTAEVVGLLAGQQRYDWLLVDTPPAQMVRLDDAIMQADLVLIPVKASFLDLHAMQPVVDICEEFHKPFLFVLSQIDPRRKLVEPARKGLTVLGPVADTAIADRVAYIAAMARGLGPSEVDKDGKVAEEIDALWAEVRAAVAGSKRGGKRGRG